MLFVKCQDVSGASFNLFIVVFNESSESFLLFDEVVSFDEVLEDLLLLREDLKFFIIGVNFGL